VGQQSDASSSPEELAAVSEPVRRGARVERVLGAFQALNTAAAAADGIDAVLAAIAEQMSGLLDLSRCAVYLHDESSDLYRGRLLRVDGHVDDSIRELECGVDADGLTREILLVRRPVLVTDARSDPRPVHSMMVKAGVGALFGIPMISAGAVVGLIYLDDQGRPMTVTEEDQELSLVLAEHAALSIDRVLAAAKLETAQQTVERQTEAFRRVSIAESKLSELVLGGAGLDDIASSIAQLTRKPCAIYAGDGERVASGMPPGSDEPAPLLEPEDCRRPEIARALAGMRRGVPSVIGPFLLPGFSKRLLITPVSMRGDEGGRLVLSERQTAFSAFDAHVARRAATIIAVELSARRRAAESRAHGLETLVRDLIAGVGDEAVLADRAATHGLDFGISRVVCLVTAPGSGQEAHAAAVALSNVICADPDAIVIDVREGRAVIFPVPGGGVTVLRARIERLLAAADGGYPCQVGVSNAFVTTAGYSRAYEEAGRVVRCLRTFTDVRTAHVLTAEELGAGAVFLASTSREEADRYVKHTLGVLLDPANRTMHDLLETVTAFFAAGRAARHTADLMGVHENTIRYRLARIAELTGLDIGSDADAQFAVQMSVLILRLEGRAATVAPAVAST
jgi:sugar diacid utilization regulator